MFYVEYNEPWYIQELIPFVLIGVLGVSAYISYTGTDSVLFWGFYLRKGFIQ